MNALVAVVRKSLTELDLGLKGALAMSNQPDPELLDGPPTSNLSQMELLFNFQYFDSIIQMIFIG